MAFRRRLVYRKRPTFKPRYRRVRRRVIRRRRY